MIVKSGMSSREFNINFLTEKAKFMKTISLMIVKSGMSSREFNINFLTEKAKFMQNISMTNLSRELKGEVFLHWDSLVRQKSKPGNSF